MTQPTAATPAASGYAPQFGEQQRPDGINREGRGRVAEPRPSDQLNLIGEENDGFGTLQEGIDIPGVLPKRTSIFDIASSISSRRINAAILVYVLAHKSQSPHTTKIKYYLSFSGD